MLSDDFAYWLSVQGKPGILPNQVKSVKDILNNTPEADLISVMYYGADDLACKALKELKRRFENELNALEEMHQHCDRERAVHESDWN